MSRMHLVVLSVAVALLQPSVALSQFTPGAAPHPRTLAGHKHINLRQFYKRRGHDSAAKNQRQPSKHFGSPRGEAQKRLARDKAAAERMETKRALQAQGRAAQKLFRGHDNDIVATKGQVTMSDGRTITVKAEVDRGMGLKVTLPPGSWFSFNMAAFNLQGMKHKNPMPVVVSGKIHPETGLFHLRDGGTNIVGKVSKSGEIKLGQLDARFGGSRVLKLRPNKTATATGGHNGSYRSSVSVSEWSLGKPR